MYFSTNTHSDLWHVGSLMWFYLYDTAPQQSSQDILAHTHFIKGRISMIPYELALGDSGDEELPFYRKRPLVEPG